MDYLEFLKREFTMLQDIRKKYPNHHNNPDLVSVITATNKLFFINNIFTNYQQQNYKNKELIIILNNNQLQLAQWLAYSKNYQKVQIYQLDEDTSLGECLNFAIAKSSGSYICKFDDDDYYAPNFLTDLMACFLFTDAALVGKSVHFVYFEGSQTLRIFNRSQGYGYAQTLPGGAQIGKRKIFEDVNYDDLDLGEDVSFVETCLDRGLKLYAADPFNFTAVRYGDPNLHTWKIEERDYLRCLNFIAETNDFKKIVSV